MPNDLTTKSGALWVQPDGPNTQVYYLGCHGLDEIAEAFGGIELLRNFEPDGSGWFTSGQTVAPPDPVTFTVNTRLSSVRSLMQTLNCPFSFYALQRDCGRADEFDNYVRGDILTGCRVTNKTKGPIAAMEEDTVSDLSVDVEAWPPVIEVPNLVIDRLTANVLSISDAYCAIPNLDLRCYGACGDSLARGERVVMTGESGAAALVAEIEFSPDSGANFTYSAAPPFDAGDGALSGTYFSMGRDGYRWLLWAEPPADTQGNISYCDDMLGTTWTPVNIGGAVSHGALHGQAVFSLHGRFIFLAGNLGAIWKSTDYGVTWRNVDVAGTLATDYYCTHFADEYYGMAGGNAGIVSITSDGGETWEAGGVVGAGEIMCCWRHDKNRLWVGTDDGELFFSRDGGATWTERTGWVGAGAGMVRGMSWYDDHYGFMVHNIVAGTVGTVFRTINGGYNWEAITTPTNAGLNHIACVSPSLAYAAGDASGGTNVYLKIREGA